MHLVVLYGYQGADSDAEQLALTEQLFDAALGELGVVARGQPCPAVVQQLIDHETLEVQVLERIQERSVRRQFAGGFQPRRMCKYFNQGRCHRDGTFTFAHHVYELHTGVVIDDFHHDDWVQWTDEDTGVTSWHRWTVHPDFFDEATLEWVQDLPP